MNHQKHAAHSCYSFMTMLCLWLMLGLTDARAGARTELAGAGLGLPPVKTTSATGETALVSLGKRLFFDTRLSADGKVSCATCHVPGMAFSDGRTQSVGHDGRIGTRNAPSLMNVVYADSLFWDGRAKDLESQALAPLTNPVEHALSSEGAVADVVRGDHDFARTFAQVFHTQPALITAGMVSRALSAYERSLIAADSPFDRYLYGHDTQALTPAAARGLDLFRGRAQCASCHAIGTTAALLTDGEFHISPSGVPAVVNANLGALASKVVATANSGHRRELEQLIATDRDIAALGRFIVTLNPADIGKFKTPSLRNVALTAPYMHDGSVATLERAVELESYGRGKALNYPIPLTVGEREDLVEFLRTLTSPYARQRPPPE